MAKKLPFFSPEGLNFAKIKKMVWTFSYFYPREVVYQISENLAYQTWRKCVTNEQTNRWDWNHRSLWKNSGNQKTYAPYERIFWTNWQTKECKSIAPPKFLGQPNITEFTNRLAGILIRFIIWFIYSFTECKKKRRREK